MLKIIVIWLLFSVWVFALMWIYYMHLVVPTMEYVNLGLVDDDDINRGGG